MNFYLLIAPRVFDICLHDHQITCYFVRYLLVYQSDWSSKMVKIHRGSIVVVIVGGRLVGSTQLPFITIGGRKSLVNAQMLLLLEKVWWVPRVN